MSIRQKEIKRDAKCTTCDVGQYTITINNRERDKKENQCMYVVVRTRGYAAHKMLSL